MPLGVSAQAPQLQYRELSLGVSAHSNTTTAAPRETTGSVCRNTTTAVLRAATGSVCTIKHHNCSTESCHWECLHNQTPQLQYQELPLGVSAQSNTTTAVPRDATGSVCTNTTTAVPRAATGSVCINSMAAVLRAATGSVCTIKHHNYSTKSCHWECLHNQTPQLEYQEKPLGVSAQTPQLQCQELPLGVSAQSNTTTAVPRAATGSVCINSMPSVLRAATGSVCTIKHHNCSTKSCHWECLLNQTPQLQYREKPLGVSTQTPQLQYRELPLGVSAQSNTTTAVPREATGSAYIINPSHCAHVLQAPYDT
ncbi:hypothetical protein NDU88_008721 [Pleurodeles waltl]|uniref:Uncharacterized protein n=1 Tax=Pleurodeles waltl TaxID=8319 RepID=A0AAV7N825_PLEWA|nr:hypothetical protein NDU88_008721 [Pleurodeles waltl]